MPTCSGAFCLSQLQSKGEHCICLWSAWGLSSPGKQVGRSSTPCPKGSQVWGIESEQWPKYMQQRCRYWKWENFEKQAQCSKIFFSLNWGMFFYLQECLCCIHAVIFAILFSPYIHAVLIITFLSAIKSIAVTQMFPPSLANIWPVRLLQILILVSMDVFSPDRV